MRYTVSSHGRPIGVTDLGFARADGPSRSGWLHPNEHGERTMTTLVSPDARLTLHREDGSLVPTTRIGIEDVEQLIARADFAEARRESASWTDDAPELTIERDTDDEAGWSDDAALPHDAERVEPWEPNEEAPECPRWRIHVVLADDDAIP